MKAIPEYNFKEGDRVMVKFEHDLTQPGISKFQSNEHAPRTDVTKAVAWKLGTIDLIENNPRWFHVILDKPYKGTSSGYVELDRLQPYVWGV
jgi:hypothetical protein